MEVTIKYNEEEQEQANMSVNINRLIRVLDNVWDYAAEQNDEKLFQIIEDYMNLKEK